MHELSLCRALIDKVEEIARDRRATAVLEVRLGIGPLAGVERRLLEEAYPLACAGTLAEGSRLACESTPVRVRCRSCGAETDALPNRLLCGACGDWRTDLVAGDELMLMSLELEMPEENAELSHV